MKKLFALSFALLLTVSVANATTCRATNAMGVSFSGTSLSVMMATKRAIRACHMLTPIGLKHTCHVVSCN